MKLRLLLTIGITLAITGVFFVKPAHADVNNFAVTDFTADYYLNNDDPQGELHVVEHISVNFTDFNHGILRAIPKSYKNHSLQLKINNVDSGTGAPSQYTTYSQSGNTVIKIGDPSKTVTGNQEYAIDYTLHNVVSFYGGHDELYWDINGDDWLQPFDKVTVRMHIPANLAVKQQACYTGGFGSTEMACVREPDTDGLQVTTTRRLQANETLTVVLGFNKGYFKPPTLIDTLSDHLFQMIEGLLPPVLVGGFAFGLWLKRGRDAKGRGIIVPQYEPPEDLKPLEVGTIADFKVDNRDISATIIDLAIRGYLQIVEQIEDMKILPDKKHYILKLVKPDTTGLKEFERSLIEAIFLDFDVLAAAGSSGLPASGTSVTLDQLKNKFYSAAKNIREDVSADLAARGYFHSNPLTSGKVLIGIAVGMGLLIYVFGKLFNLATSIGLVATIPIVYIFAKLMPSRTEKGVLAEEHIKGLKLYMETAEKDRIAMLQGPDAPYAEKSSEPVKTVELFEKLLPYAIVLGVENEWAKQFKDIYTVPPGWYNGNWATFNAIYLASSLSNSIGVMNANFSPPSNAGGSGFAGGGFAGGGGGGGGGGGW